jgi:dTDP-3,4-didehydro-2,6-dideoxy-alpha-D-glucose 3-reductase
VVGASLRHDRGVDVGGCLMLRREDGVTAQLTFGMEHLYVSGYQLLGSVGRLTAEHVFTPPATHEPVLLIDRHRHRERLVLEPDDQYRKAVAAFVEAVRHGAPVSHDLVVTQAGLVDRARRLAAGPVTIQEATQQEATQHG